MPFLSILVSLSALAAFASFRVGLDHTPDSALYLFSGARAYLGNALSATPSNYAPAFPWLIALSLTVFRIPGDAATLIQALALFCVLLGSYASLRRVAAPRGFSLGAAVLVGYYPSTASVLLVQLTEGPLCAAYLGIMVAAGCWLRTRRRRWALAMFGIATFTPFLRYVSAFAPLVVAAFWAVNAEPTLSRLHRLGRFASSAALGLSPIALYMIYNRMREGFVTSHPPSSRGWAENTSAALNTLLESPTPTTTLYLACALASCVAALMRRQTRAALFAPELVLAIVLAVGYFGALVAGASVVLVDRLSLRLCAPGITMAVLALSMAAGRSISLLSQGLPSRVAAQVVLLSLSLLGVRTALIESLYQPLAARATVRKAAGSSAWQYGFRQSSSAEGYNAFLAELLTESSDVSLTLLEAQRSVGTVRRSWMAIAGALGNHARRIRGVGKVSLDLVEEETVRYRVGGNDKMLLYLSSDISEKRVRPQAPDDPSIRDLISELATRVADAARARGRSEHWLLVPKKAAWFTFASEPAPGVSLLESRSAGGYHAYRLGL